MATCLPAQANLTKEIEDALNFYHYGSKGAVKLDVNYRWENVNEYAGQRIPGSVPPRTVETGNANTIRMRLGLLSPTFYGIQAYAEYEGNHAMQEDYNSTRNNLRQYSVVADPDKDELNQAWLSYKGIPDTLVKVGRQRIKFDDDRFIGNVGWRQLEMTYDSVLFTHNNQTLFGLTANVGYIDSVRSIFSTKQSMNSPILNLNYKVGDWGNLIGYGYWLDYREPENFHLSSQTYGLRFNGKSPQFFDHFSTVYTAEWGHQADYSDNPNRYDADRINLMGGLSAYGLTVSGAVEQLNGYGRNRTFNTPLGTNHAFQGWADLFINPMNNDTLGQGIRDVFATVTYKLMNDTLTLVGAYHDFSDDTGKMQFGKEWNFSAQKKFGKHYTLLAKYANYNADSYATDTQRIWMEANVSF
ncbi:MAG: hypothetical protein CTY22_11935 [Methylomonas sp.]|nr:MAG: hypothetical protein CTY23_03860 [Methylomonas sp.]PPD23647.1 MAG: hypothetical protein CTY22_11935 [Methylomonas sp.]PPD31466.1 MAG: hypothetical protein CTY21_12100 [Methylomonas sp.]PPD39206.1 MAG: hypothetical protein CTY17_08395 [Methylomonas sp.]PPD55653.1 MAG: hypothetical protein CTY11_01175 [Methylomonas sp.]